MTVLMMENHLGWRKIPWKVIRKNRLKAIQNEPLKEHPKEMWMEQLMAQLKVLMMQHQNDPLKVLQKEPTLVQKKVTQKKLSMVPLTEVQMEVSVSLRKDQPKVPSTSPPMALMIALQMEHWKELQMVK
jgi:hypothetical protein